MRRNFFPFFAALSSLLLLFLAGAFPFPAGAAEAVPQAGRIELPISGGRIRGVAYSRSFFFSGIPYAQPPVGALRWRPPQPLQPWQGVVDCVWNPQLCPQPGERPGYPESEDCLRLSIWTPDLVPEKPLPVFVWIHGGAFVTGGGTLPLYDGRVLAERYNFVVVTINYRLGPFGFFTHPELEREAGNSGVGNYGLMDQLAALEWVRDNIRSFGGDPGNVTLAGESAGAMSVDALLWNPRARGLFHRAVIESGTLLGGGFLFSNRYLRPESVRAESARAARMLGADDSAEGLRKLRELPPEELLKIQSDFIGWRDAAEKVVFAPALDGVWMPANPLRALERGEYATLPVIVGFNTDEETLFIERFLDQAAAESLVERSCGGEAAAELAGCFRSDDWRSYPGVSIRMLGFHTPARMLADGLAKAGSPVYFYWFAKVPVENRGKYIGCPHGTEIGYIFGNLNSFAQGVDGEISSDLAERLCGFARNNVPEAKGRLPWPRYTPDKQEFLRIENPFVPGQKPDGKHAAMIERMIRAIWK